MKILKVFSILSLLLSLSAFSMALESPTTEDEDQTTERPTDETTEIKPEEKPVTGTISGTVNHKRLFRAGKKYNTYVFIEEIPNAAFPKAETDKGPLIDMKSYEFVPNFLSIGTGTTVRFSNLDGVGHNVYTRDGEKFKLKTWSDTTIKSYTFTKTGFYNLGCFWHRNMYALIAVMQNPFITTLDREKGTFKLENVPAGDWKLKFWSKRISGKYLTKTFEVSVKEGETTKIDIIKK